MPTTIPKLSTLASRARDLGREYRAHHPRDPRVRSLPTLLFVTDQDRVTNPVRAITRLPRGAGVILRHRDARARARLATALAPLCRRRGVLFLIAADPRLAAKVGADGVHFPEIRAPEARAWRRKRPWWLVTVAAHGGHALRTAARSGAHAALLSPVFATASHPAARTLGPVRFARLVRRASLPVYALGGVTATTAPRLQSSGAVGLAATGGLVGTSAGKPASTG